MLAVGTDIGCFLSLDGGTRWSPAHPDLPPVPVHDLVIQERENELVIGTHGRSFYVLDLAPVLDHWKGEDPATRTFAVLEAPEKTWNKRWGKPGWAWAEPKPVEATGVLFAPTGGTLWIDFEDRSIDAGPLLPGFLPFAVPLATGGDPAYPPAGTYPFRLRLIAPDGTTLRTESTLTLTPPKD
jgi:hypothetical protein